MRISGTHVVLAAELLRQGGGHNLAANGRGRVEVRLARLAPGGGDVWTWEGHVSTNELTVHTTSTMHPIHPA